MNTINLSVEELIFCFYSEGMFEQGLEMKRHLFPEMDDNELEFMFQITCRSLLAKDLLEFKNHVYKVKEDYSPYIQVLNSAIYTVRASKYLPGEENEVNISLHYTNSGYFLHQLLHDQQVHQIAKLESKEELMDILKRFFNMEQLPEESDALFVMQNEDFEVLLKGANENEELVWKIINKYDGNKDLTNEFARDLVSRKGLMDSIMLLKYDEHNIPEIIDLTLCVQGTKQMWFINGSIKDQFTLKVANNDVLRNMVKWEDNSISLT